MDQAQWIHDFNDRTRQQFNQELFYRDDYEVVEALKDVILSCQRDKYFTIRVDKFTLVEDYAQIHNILYNYEQEKIDRNKNKSKKLENTYKYIHLKDTDMMLLLVDYYIAVNDPVNFKCDTLRVIIEVPRIVDKYYYKIKGNYFSAIYQIVDGSTYNNTSSNSKKQSVTFKTIFMPTRLYRNQYEIEDSIGNPVKYTVYSSRIFSKNVPVIEYFLAKFGLFETIEYMGLQNSMTILPYQDDRLEEDDRYCFYINNIFIYVPKVLFDQDIALQCLVMTIYRNLTTKKAQSKNQANKFPLPDVTYENIKGMNYWLMSLATRFNSKPTVEKGLSILDSLESIYDIDTMKSLRLLDRDKRDIYTILRWMVREFQYLRLKDNADISTKKIRRPGYIASIYGAKLCMGIYRASDSQKKITVKDIKRYIKIEPDFLINAVVKDKLVSFRNSVNDNDAYTALKFSFKGRSGLGEQVNSTIPDSYRQLHPSALTRIDPDTSSASDPGLTGIICPMAKINNNSFADEDFLESGDWEERFNIILQQYYAMRQEYQVITFQNEFKDIFDIASSINIDERKDLIEYCMEQQENVLKTMSGVDDESELYDTSISEDSNTVIVWFDSKNK